MMDAQLNPYRNYCILFANCSFGAKIKYLHIIDEKQTVINILLTALCEKKYYAKYSPSLQEMQGILNAVGLWGALSLSLGLSFRLLFRAVR
jgi:hypothetical protein